jgi:TonB family protein
MREAAPPRPHTSQQPLDLSFAPTAGGGEITQLHPNGQGADIGSDWENLLSEWWIRHRFYPEEAARLDQQGEVTLLVVVAPDGQVKSVKVEQTSGSPWIDLGALQTLHGAKLPPLPKDFTDPELFLEYHLHYYLIR